MCGVEEWDCAPSSVLVHGLHAGFFFLSGFSGVSEGRKNGGANCDRGVIGPLGEVGCNLGHH